jgi:hypothetical protein
VDREGGRELRSGGILATKFQNLIQIMTFTSLVYMGWGG